jgi:hypothetical protein
LKLNLLTFYGANHTIELHIEDIAVFTKDTAAPGLDGTFASI